MSAFLILISQGEAFGFATDRRTWLVDQLSQEPITSSRGLYPYQATVGWVNYSDTSSFQATALVNLTLFEVRMRASQRVFLAMSDRGRHQRNFLEPEKTTLGFEIGRQYTSTSGHYGRLAVELLKFFPNGHTTVRAGFDTGIIEAGANRWRLGTQLHVYVQPPGGGTLYRVQARFLKRVSESNNEGLALGGFFAWNYRSNNVDSVGEHEHMLFSMGPSLDYISGASVLRAYMPIRLWLDKKIAPAPNNALATYYPLEMTIPDINVTWSFVF